MRSGYIAIAIEVWNGSEVCGMGRPMPAEVAKGGGGDLRWMVRGAWREANPDSSCSGRRAEQARVQYRHEPVGGVSPDLSVSLDDGDLMLIPGEVGGDGRWATPAKTRTTSL